MRRLATMNDDLCISGEHDRLLQAVHRLNIDDLRDIMAALPNNRWRAGMLRQLDELRLARAGTAAGAARPQPLSSSTLEAAINCVEALSTDRREPERYRTWYREALDELQAVAGSAAPTGDNDG